MFAFVEPPPILRTRVASRLGIDEKQRTRRALKLAPRYKGKKFWREWEKETWNAGEKGEREREALRMDDGLGSRRSKFK
jgi:hypothetical protein